MGNLQVRFLEGWAPAMAPGYSTKCPTSRLKNGQLPGAIRRHSKMTGSAPETAFEETSGAMHPNGPFSAIRRLRLMCIGLAAKGYPNLTDDFTAMTTSVKSS
jgi:hypothetical protein